MMYRYWKQIDKVIDKTLALEPELRVPFLEKIFNTKPEILEEAKEYLSFIEKAESENFLQSEFLTKSVLVSDIFSKISENKPLKHIIGRKIGPYEIKHLLGEGGMGSVYLADRVDGEFSQQVAIKFIRSGFYSLHLRERFNREKQLLSKLHHPNIARLLDGGITDDGSPYLIMEYVEGDPVDVYCRKQNLNLHDRLGLFRQICKAVQFAHSKLIIHRDLKPDNIFVTSGGQIKIMDFGIGKSLRPDVDEPNIDFTRNGHIIASFDFAAPEQLSNDDVFIQTDIYGMGALLYLLVTDERVFNTRKKSIAEIEHIICEQPPVRPGLRSKPGIGRISRDMEAIILKTLRKEPEKRYESVSHLTDDLDRLGDKKPVLARKGSLKYRAGKYIQRNNTMMFAAVLATSIMFFFVNYHVQQLTDERIIAEAEAEKAQAVTDFLSDIFMSADPVQNVTDTLTVYDLLDRGMTQIKLMDDKPELQVEFMLAIGNSYQKLGSYGEAEKLYEAADSLTHQLFKPNSIQALNTLYHLGSLKEISRNFLDAKNYYLKAADHLNQFPDQYWREKANVYSGLGNSLAELGRTDSAEAYLNQAYTIGKQYNRNEISLLKTQVNLAKVYRGQKKYELAEEIYLEVLSELETSKSPDIKLMAITLNNLGYLQKSAGNYRGAEFHYRKALELQKELYGNDHPNSIVVLQNLASVLSKLGNYDETLQILKEKLFVTKNRYGTHWRTGSAVGAIGRFHFQWKAFDLAAERLHQSEVIYSEVLGTDHYWTRIENLYHHIALKNSDRFNEPVSSLPAYKALNQTRDFSYHDSITVAQLIEKTEEFSIVDMEEDLHQLKALLNR